MRILTSRWYVAGLLAALAVLPFVGLTRFAHPYFDDYDVANHVAELGRWGSQWHWYQSWSGRVVTIVLDTLLDPLSWGKLGAPGSPVLVALRALLLLVQLAQLVALRLVIGALLQWLAGPLLASGPASPARQRMAWALTLGLLATGLNALPEPFSWLYWYSATFVYPLAWALSLGFGAGALRALALPAGPLRTRWALGAAGCLGAAIGCGEQAMLYCLVGLAGLGWWVRRSPVPGRRWLLPWALVAALATAVVVTAPGNWHRAAVEAYPPAHRWLLLLPRAGWALLGLAARPVVLGSLGLLAAVGLWSGQALRPQPAPRPGRAALGGALLLHIVFNGVGVLFLKLLWVAPLLDRAANLMVVGLLTSTLVLALWVGTWWRPAFILSRLQWLLPVLAGSLLAAVGQARPAWQELLLAAPTYDHQMQARYAQLHQAQAAGRPYANVPALHLPATPGVLAPLPAPGRHLDFSIEIKPTYAENAEIARHFGLQGVRRQAAGPAK